jgi:hypothetical protein
MQYLSIKAFLIKKLNPSCLERFWETATDIPILSRNDTWISFDRSRHWNIDLSIPSATVRCWETVSTALNQNTNKERRHFPLQHARKGKSRKICSFM